MKTEHRGRPKDNVEVPIRFKVEGEETTWHFDRKKHNTAPYKVLIKAIGKPNKPILDPKSKYSNHPIVLVYSTPRKNTKVKMKVFKNKNIDDIITNKQAGVPENADYLEIGLGTKFIKEYKEKYKL